MGLRPDDPMKGREPSATVTLEARRHERSLDSPRTQSLNLPRLHGVLRAAREVGRSVPGSLSVIGFDDIIMSLYVDPPLSTISFDKEAMGRQAMARLIQQVTTGASDVLEQTLPVELVVRGSSGSLKKRRGT